MNPLLLAADVNASGALSAIQGNYGWLLGAVILIVIAIVLFYVLKNILVNSVLGLIAWAVLFYLFQLKLNFWLSLIVSALFGLVGIGVLLVLKFFGIPV
ncbi:MAG: hypothetical protein V1847_04440 [Candidatus Diapherotrites archaeon]